MDLNLTAVFQKVPEGYIGFVEELPGANTQGGTLEEARVNLQEAVALVLEANRELVQETTHGGEVIREPLKVGGYEAHQDHAHRVLVLCRETQVHRVEQGVGDPDVEFPDHRECQVAEDDPLRLHDRGDDPPAQHRGAVDHHLCPSRGRSAEEDRVASRRTEPRAG